MDNQPQVVMVAAKGKHMTTKQRKLKLLNIAVVLLATYLTGYILTPVLIGEKLEIFFRPHFDEKFNPVIWKEGGLGKGHGQYGKRYEMLDNLLESHILEGLNVDQLQALLGPPDSKRDGEPNLWFYTLGDQRIFPSRAILFPGWFSNRDRWMLEVEFRNGKVSHLKVYFT